MKRLIGAICGLSPGAIHVFVYFLTATIIILAVAQGLKANGEYAGTLWGLRLKFGEPGESADHILAKCYIEMVRHVWTIVTLPFACLVGMKWLLRSFRPDFQAFLRYGNSSCLFIETARISALLSIVLMAMVPLLAGALWGILQPGVSGEAVLDILVPCLGCLLFATTLVYLLGSLDVPGEIAAAIGLVAPFLLTGVSIVLDRGGQGNVSGSLPPGLPYYVDDWRSSNLGAGAVAAAFGIAMRLLVVGRTRWLRE